MKKNDIQDNNKFNIQKQTSTTKLQAFAIKQAHTEGSKAKRVCRCTNKKYKDTKY